MASRRRSPLEGRRLGYACVNVTLGRKIRTTRLANATPARVEELARQNLETVEAMATWNAAHGIRMMRLSSDLVPFAGRADVHPEWPDRLRDDFARVGETLRVLNQRVSAHPGQFTVLSSPRPEVVEAAVADLEAQAAYFELMRLPAELVVHVGGVFGDRAAALARFVDGVARLSPSARSRLVVENDDRCHGIDAALDVAERARIPVVFDAFHHSLLSDGRDEDDALRDALSTWRHRPARVPKIHWSDAAPGKRRGSHGDRVDPPRLLAFLARHRGRAFDVMLEAKLKELAVLDVFRAVASPTTEARSVAKGA